MFGKGFHVPAHYVLIINIMVFSKRVKTDWEFGLPIFKIYIKSSGSHLVVPVLFTVLLLHYYLLHYHYLEQTAC